MQNEEELAELRRIREHYSDRVKMFVDPAFCGTKGLFNRKYGGQTLPGRPRLDALVKAIDTYDCWRTERPEFLTVSYGLNDLFWALGFNGFVEALKDASITDDHRKIIRAVEAERKVHLDTALQNSTIVEELNLLIVHSPSCKFVNDFVLRYPDFDFYLILKTVFDRQLGWSFRIKTECPFDTSHVLEGLKSGYGRAISMGGHKKACGITIDNEDLEEFLDRFTQLVFETREGQ
jgi:oligoribonuclease NrnB/cAMP/cGMP phosphodiesterase (DHH superfamily)